MGFGLSTVACLVGITLSSKVTEEADDIFCLSTDEDCDAFTFFGQFKLSLVCELDLILKEVVRHFDLADISSASLRPELCGKEVPRVLFFELIWQICCCLPHFKIKIAALVRVVCSQFQLSCCAGTQQQDNEDS